MRWERVWCTYMVRNAKSPIGLQPRVFLLESPEGTWQTPSVSSLSTVASLEPAVKIGLSDSVYTLFYDVLFVR